jgi:hypothetical protein
MRCGDEWTDITILNISSRGLMARTTDVPAARSYVEIRRGPSTTIVGKVVWHDSRHFGIRTQDRIGIDMLGDGCSAARQYTSVERRARPRSNQTDPADAFARSRHKAALFQFAILSLAGIAGAIVIGSTVMNVLGRPFAIIAQQLS